MVVSPAPDQAAEVTSNNPHATPRSATFRLVLLVVLVLALLVAAGALVWRLAQQGDADDVQAEREPRCPRPSSSCSALGTFGPDLLDDQGGMPEYRERVKEVITPKFAPSFDKQAARRRAAGRPGRPGPRAPRSSPPASPSLDSDSAQALVAGSITDSYPASGRRGRTGKRTTQSRCRSGSRSPWSRSTASGWSTTSTPGDRRPSDE